MGQIRMRLCDQTLNEAFDFIYARLVLHYLPKDLLIQTLDELYRITRAGGKIFIVVRSTECPEAKQKGATFDPQTKMTIYLLDNSELSRYFHTEESIQNYLIAAGFKINHIKTYSERLCIDFDRTKPSKDVDSLIEVFAVK